MGEPSNLPDFAGLSRVIGMGTGVERLPDEPEDRFLGRLLDSGVRVHDIAAFHLAKDGPQLTNLHRDILRLFPNGVSPRVVTTNFDLLFEQSAKELFGVEPDVFRAPALPLGREFEGIVHIHGDLASPSGMVLTDKEFGRAYLTDGHSRLFLVELFRTFDVLFVGYSHSDTVMNYLARALPADQTKHRFALTDDGDGGHWRFLGIEPVDYSNPDGTHGVLYSGMAGLSENLQRGSLDWQQTIAAIATASPLFLNDEEVDLIADAFSDVTRTRFFTAVASDPKWIDWLDHRGFLGNLFETKELLPQEVQLANWLASTFALDHSHQLFRLISSHGMLINPEFWLHLGHAAGQRNDPTVSPDVLAKWMSLLLSSVPLIKPHDMHSAFLVLLSERCSEVGLVESLLDIFKVMSTNRLGLGRWGGTVEPSFVVDHYQLNEIWENGLKPHLDSVAELLLKEVVENLRSQFSTRSIWAEEDHQSDSTSWHRSAIELHEQDADPEPMDVLIDAARDCLESLALHHPVQLAYWADVLATSDAPLLHRLAVHVLAQRTDLSADEKIDWLLSKLDLQDQWAHHEIFRSMKLIYPSAGEDRRRTVIETVFSFQCPDKDDEEKERQTAYQHFKWFRWLCDADPDCQLSQAALDVVLEAFPDFRQGEHPDFIHWSDSGFVTPTSPWSAQELVSTPAEDRLDDLLTFQGTEWSGPDRRGLSEQVREAALQDFDWGLELARALATNGCWDSDLWPSLLEVWSNELGEENHQKILELVCNPELLSRRPKAIANALLSLVKDGGTPYAPALLPLSNSIAAAVVTYLSDEKPFATETDWLMQGMNHPAGILAEYWLQSLSIYRKQQTPMPTAMGGEYLGALSAIVKDKTVVGTLGKAILCTRLSFLLGADYNWTTESLRPIFTNFENQEESQAAWHGFIYGGPLNPPISEWMAEGFLGAVSRLDTIFPKQELRQYFIQRLAAMVVYFVEDPFEKWMPDFFTKAVLASDREHFTWSIGVLLNSMDDTRQRQVWERMLRRYWEDRLRGVPAPPPDAAEIKAILDWLPHFQSLFPEAVELATKTWGERLDSHLLVHRIASNGLWQLHPEATASLLVHLGYMTKEEANWMWHREQDLLNGLLDVGISEDAERGIRELMERVGIT